MLLPDGHGGGGAAAVRRHAEVAHRIKRFLRGCATSFGRVEVLDLGPARRAALIGKATGREVEGFALVLENNNARHALKHHANVRVEACRGRLPLDHDDLAHIAEILAEPDRIEPGDPTRRGAPTAIFWKRIGKIEYKVVAEIRPGARQIAFKTMMKRLRRYENEP